MSMELKARDLIAAGWPEGRRLGLALVAGSRASSDAAPRASAAPRAAGWG